MPNSTSQITEASVNTRQATTNPRRTRCRACHALQPRRNITVLPQTLRVYNSSQPNTRAGSFEEFPSERARVCTHHLADGDVIRCGADDYTSGSAMTLSDWTPPTGACGTWILRNNAFNVRGSLLGMPPATLEGDRLYHVCAECASRLGTVLRQCTACGCHVVQEAATSYSYNHTWFCHTCTPYYFSCADCGRVRNTRENRIFNNPEGNRICNYCQANYFVCNNCSGRFHNDAQGIRGFCSTCTPDMESDNFPWEAAIDNRYIDRSPRTFAGNATKTTRTRSKRMFGVELEFSRSSRIAAGYLCDKFGWGAKPDGTAGVVQEFVSPPMFGDDGISNVEDFCQRAVKCALQVDRSCGYHLHVDVSSERKIALSRIACAYQTFLPLWRCFVPPSRRTNRYCNADAGNGTPEQIAQGAIKPFEMDRTRYSAINWQSYHRHRTVENRLHTGTCSSDKVVSWIRANVAFVEWSRGLPFATILQYWRAPVTQQIKALKEAGVWDDEIVQFYISRARKFGVDLTTDRTTAVPTSPQSPFEPNWVWEDDDYRRTRRWLGINSGESLEQGELVDAWRAGVLSRPCTDRSGSIPFEVEIGVPLVRGYRENTDEYDP